MRVRYAFESWPIEVFLCIQYVGRYMYNVYNYLYTMRILHEFGRMQRVVQKGHKKFSINIMHKQLIEPYVSFNFQ